MTPFILRGRTDLPPESEPGVEHEFDRDHQIWIHKPSGMPLVLALRDQEATSFGETTITATQEGHDASEGRSPIGSPYGETTITETREGHDAPESITGLVSPYGETTFTRTQEGTDISETGNLMSAFGETTYTASVEGHDQRESPRPPTGYDAAEDETAASRGGKEVSFVPPYSHF